ncbi:MAG TPA: alpha/beta hydrolase [Halobacteriales archaeon]|nr:alpha/beta hydrolase [Halobacteriales archaeon]
MADEPHPQVQEFLAWLNSQPTPPTPGLAPEAARERMVRLFAGGDDPEPVGRVDDFAISGPDEPIPVRLYHPEGDGPNPILVYFHGGGHMLGDLDVTDGVCRALVNEGDVVLLSVDYRLTPENRFPAGLLDAYAAVEWAAEYAEDVGADPGRLAVGGASAGGNLAAAVSLFARDDGGPPIAHQLLIYPAVRSPIQPEFDSLSDNAEGYLLERDSMLYYRENYLRFPTDARNEYAYPLLADDLAGLPSATVITAGFDPLHDEGEAYAEKLADAGVDVTYEDYDDQIHGFTGLLGTLDAARESMAFMGERLRDELGN